MSHGAQPAPESLKRTGTPIGSAMAILRCFTPGQPLLGVTALADRVGVHKSSVSRMLATLEAEGLVERDTVSGKYRLGLGVLTLSAALLADLDVRRVARPVLEKLSHELGETCSLMLWTGDRAVSVEHVPSTRPIRHEAQLGTSYSSIASSSVRVFLATLPRDEVIALVREGWVRSDIGVNEAIEQLTQDARAGVSINDGRTEPDEVGISAPVIDRSGEVVAAVLLSAPRYRVDAERLKVFEMAVRSGAAEISTRLVG